MWLSGNKRFLLCLYVVSLILARTLNSGPANAYKIRPSKEIHEAITLLAEQCVIEAAPAEPRDCRRFEEMIGPLSDRRFLGARARRSNHTYSDLQRTVRWADDPGRQLVNTGILSFGVNMKGNCERRIRRNPQERLDTIGILCTSHFGRMQFLHAQASALGETTEDTRAKILDWADLTFRLGTGLLRANAAICSHFDANHSEIAAAFELDPDHCTRPLEEQWTLATIFNWRCRGITMRSCGQMLGRETRDTLAATVARGALLHMIQDSYSESHVDRGEAAPFRSRVSCRLPLAFHNFLGQVGHGRADFVPDFTPSCDQSDRTADDVITASAMAIYHLQNRTDPYCFGLYLQERVFGASARGGSAETADGRNDCRTRSS